MASSSIRYDISTGMRLLRAMPVVLGYLALLVVVFLSLPEKAQRMPLEAVVMIGIIGLFRYGWVLTHCARAAIYEHYLYPKLRFEADQLPESLRHPKRVFFIIPTFGEKPDVSRQMLRSVLDEAADIPSRVTIVVNAGSEQDDAVFRATLAERPSLPNVEMMFIRQIGGKRQGLADCLVRLMQEPVGDNDAIVLMDGDTVLGQGILRKCCP